jgi:hypothetical protein
VEIILKEAAQKENENINQNGNLLAWSSMRTHRYSNN